MGGATYPKGCDPVSKDLNSNICVVQYKLHISTADSGIFELHYFNFVLSYVSEKKEGSYK